jgi:polyribonucleotide nucleotidyltransferase
VAGRELADGDVAIMMVEAGGTEKSWSYYEDGAPKVDEAVLAQGLEASKRWIKESIALQRKLVEAAPKREPLKYTPVLDYGDDVKDAVAGEVKADLEAAAAIALKADRNAATDAAGAKAVEVLAGQFPGREKEIKEAVRSLTKQIVRSRIVNEGIRIDGRGPKDDPRAVGRGRPRAHRPRLGRCSSVARPRC